MVKDSIKDYINNFVSSLKNIDEEKIMALKEEFLKRINSSHEIFIIGNGGSAANANHIAGDYLKTFSLSGLSLKISSLSENICYLTAAANDTDFSEVYEILINTRVSKGDLLIFLSGSGNSINLIKPARTAKSEGITTAAIVGYSGGALKDIVEIPIHIDLKDMEIAEDAQMFIFHYLKQILYKKLIKADELSSKYSKRTNEGLIA